MKLGILSDAHGNITGLNRCLDYLSDMHVEKVIFLGDAIGYFPNPSETVSSLKDRGVHCLLGNHEAMLLGLLSFDKKNENVYQIKENKKNINKELKQYISAWLPWYELEIDQRKLLFVHGSPSNPLNGYIYPDTNIEYFKKFNYDVIFMGHTHRPFIKNIFGDKLAINVGSCGLPRDQGNLLSCAIYDTDTHFCEIYRILYDVEKVILKYQNKIHSSISKCLKRKCENIYGSIID